VNDGALLLICVAALAAVFALLGVLALVIRALSFLFPEHERPVRDDTAMVAAVASVVTAAHPGMRITRVVEE